MHVLHSFHFKIGLVCGCYCSPHFLMMKLRLREVTLAAGHRSLICDSLPWICFMS